MSVGGLNSWATVVGRNSGTGDVVLGGLPSGKLAIGLDATGAGKVLAGSESATTAGQYTITGRSATTAATVAIFVL